MAQFQVNPMQLIQMIKSGKNPQQLMLSLLEQRAKENPMFNNLYQMAKSNDEKGIETFARNLAKERGIDFDKEFNAFKKQLGV